MRTGQPAATLLDPGGAFAYLAAHPAEAAIFNAAMTAKSHALMRTRDLQRRVLFWKRSRM